MVTVNGKIIPLTHTICAFSAFFAALVTGYSLHFHKIVTNAHYTYPDEWFPSVSATIGDRYPERSIFQILIALTSFPRFLLLVGHYYLNKSKICLLVGVLRTISCGGWVYITSTDDHDIHDIFMIAYIILTLPWDIMITRYSGPLTSKNKGLTATIFFGTLFPMVYWYIQHSVQQRAGAYSIYAYFEWSLIILDIAFDAFAYADFKKIDIVLGFNEKPGNTSFFQIKDSDAIVYGEKKTTNLRKNQAEKKVAKKEAVSFDAADSYFKFDSFFYLLTNFFNGFLFWSNTTSLFCSIWHFPLWYMGISGYETSMFCLLGPIFLYLPLVSEVFTQYGVLLGGIVAIGAYIVEMPELRLITLAIGTSITVSTFVQNLRYIVSAEISASFAVTWSLGLVASMIFKMGFYTNNPTWVILNERNGGYNKTALVFTVLFGMLSPYVNSINFQGKRVAQAKSISCIGKLFLAVGFGTLLFGIHQLLTDASTTIYWAWEGYHEKSHGPLPWPWSALTCTVLLFAAVTSVKFMGKPLVPCLLLVISTAVLSIKSITEWPKYVAGGLLYAIAMLWLVPSYFSVLGQVQSIWVYVLSFAVYVIFVLAHVWVVAYAFVPLGWLLRERIEAILAVSSTFIILGMLINNSFNLRLTKVSKKLYTYISLFAIALLALTARFTYDIRPTGIPQPYHPDSQLISAGIWTIHFGLDNDMWASEDRMINLIKEMELDVVGLLETDTQRIIMGNRDLTSKLAHDLNMYADFGPGPNKHTWGCILLSKFPIINATHHLLPSPVGELAPAIHATLQTYNDTLVDVFVFHSGQEEDEEDRRLQSNYMAKLMGNSTRPAILLSYLVVDPGEGNYNTHVSETSGMHDIDPTDDDRWCEYILYKDLRRTGYARVARGTITDTELQVGKFQVLNEQELAERSDSIYKYDHVDEPENEDMKFPDRFLGEGERGHFYHVFDKPRYYP
ncbi:hypothetical protein SUVZ_03G0770 [Saccharomyces uvarum]|uniref:Calcofluor white hypersensitive protein n=1 Tax=Saccharomyces uvarum TaxID=230603 RepID=A0ABN8WPT3_SACUV|nr:hypothetical protein SUVZ_03G0770 [Saccharomyces uvarum]